MCEFAIVFVFQMFFRHVNLAKSMKTNAKIEKKNNILIIFAITLNEYIIDSLYMQHM